MGGVGGTPPFDSSLAHLHLFLYALIVDGQKMTALYSDTHPKMEALQIQLLRQASPTRKMNMLAQLNASARLLALTGLRSRFPQASEAELHFKLAELLLGNDLARKVCGDIGHAK